MNHVAFFFGSTAVYWHGCIMALAILGAVLAGVMLRTMQNKTPNAVLLTAVLSLPLGLLCSRLVYWYCAFEQYDGIFDALTSFGEGGHSLAGAMIGVLLACVIAWRMGVTASFAQLLDCVVPAGLLGIGIGRLSGFFSADDKSKIIFESEVLQRLPFSTEIINEATGVSEWRFATFLFEALAALIAFVVCVRMVAKSRQQGSSRQTQSIPNGAVALMGMSIFGSTQVVLESTRYDSLFLRSNGFISLMQMVGLVMMLIPLVIFSVWSIRKGGSTTGRHVFGWLLSTVLLGEAAYMEYYVQRHASDYVICYAVMLLCVLLVCLITSTFCSACSEEQ